MEATTSSDKFVADRGRRVRHPRARAVDKLFRSDEHVPGWSQVSKLAVSSMFQQSTLRHGPVDTRLFLTGSQIYNVVFVTSGSVREEYADGKARLWGEGAVLGYWYESSDALPPSRGYSLTSGTAVISIAPDALRMLMLQHSDLALGVMHLITAHHWVTEDVYGVCKESPASRVARLLLYLSQASLAERPVIRTRSREDGKSVVRPIPGGIVEGPTQADIADALGLARATVEKIIATFRAEGVLWKPSPGERRRNRVYEIQDRTLLEEIAGRRSWY